MGIFAWIIMGLVAGVAARSILKYPGGWGASLVVGVVGSIVGGWIGDLLFNRGSLSIWSPGSWILAIGGSVLVLWLWTLLTKKRR